MEEQNKFEDLILANDTKKNKQKQVIFRVIIFVIIFLIVAIVYKLLVGPTDNSRPPLPPQESNVSFESKSDDNEVFENIKSDNEGFSDDFGSLEERLKKENNIVDETPKKSQEAENIVKELANAEIKTPAKEEKKQEQFKKPEVTEKPAEKPVEKSVEKPVQKQETPKEVAKPKKQESSIFDTIDVKKATKPQTISGDGAYVQVYASKNIDMKSHEIKKLDKLGLQYKVVTDNTGMSRVIIGPYSQDDKAEALKFIRENVKKDAFFYRAK